MASFLQDLKDERQDVINDYYDKINQAEDNRTHEKKAAIYIQKNFRMYLVLTNFKTSKRAVMNIKRQWKGFKIRMQFLRLMKEEKQRMQLKFFNTMGIIIQKMFRGYYVRKYKHDFYARKRYLNNVAQKNKDVREKLEDYVKISEIEEQKRKEEIARLELTKVASNVHHL